MKRQTISALVAAISVVGVAGFCHAQGLPPMYRPPINDVPGPYRETAPPGYLHSETLPGDEALLPREVVGIVRSMGFSPLAAPVRRGRFYLVIALDRNGGQGGVTVDAINGRLISFVRSDRRSDADSGAIATRPSHVSAPSVPRGLRPPAPVPNVAPRTTTAPLPLTRPNTADAALVPNDGAPGAGNKVAENSNVQGKAAGAEPVEIKPVFATPPGPKLLPTAAMPPMQSFE